MNAYFTTDVLSVESIRVYVDNIYKILEENGCKVDKFNYKKDPTLEKKGDSDIINAYKYIVKAIKKSDFVVAELTSQSAAVGFEIALALGEKKPVLVLYNSNQTKRISTPFKGNTSRLLKVRMYSSCEDLKIIITQFLDEIKELLNTKFILILPTYIDLYLEWKSKESGISKAEVTRTAIELLMQKDTQYKSYLESIFKDGSG